MRPRIDEALAKKIAASPSPVARTTVAKTQAKTEKKESQPQPAPAQPTKKRATLPGPVELYVEIITREDRQVPAWAFIRDEDHAECLQRNKPLCECIRKQVVPENLQHVHGVLFLGSVLAQSDFLAQIARLPIYGELAEPVGNSYLIATVHPDSLKTVNPENTTTAK